MALALATSITMNTGLYWSAGSASQTIPSSATSDNITSGYNASHAASSSSGLYDGLPNSQTPYNDYSSRSQTQGQPALQPVHRLSATSSSSLQYALRPHAQLANLASLTSITKMSSISAGPMSSLSPLSPLAPSQIDGDAGAGMETTSPDEAVYHYRYPHPQNQLHEAQSETRAYVHSQWYQAQTHAANALNNALGSAHNNFGNGNGASSGNENFDLNSNSRLYTFDSPPGPFDQEDEPGSTPVSLNSAGANAGSRSPGSGSGMSSPAPARTHHHPTQAIQVSQPVYTRLSDAHTHASHGAADFKERHYFHASDGGPGSGSGSGSGGAIQPCVKTEPDLEEHSHPVHAARTEGEDEGGEEEGRGAARFVMEHPYPYSYASSKSTRGREEERGSSFSPTSDTPVSPVHSLSPGTLSQSSTTFSLFEHQQQTQSQPHSLTAPLRAANATAAMRACMGVFRLDPFAQLNGVALRCGFVTDPSSFSDFSWKGREKSKAKAKAKRKMKATKKRKRRGSEAAYIADPDDESEDDFDEEDSVNGAPTWDGGQAGPLKEEPVMIEFQLYFEGMEVEGSDTEPGAAAGGATARLAGNDSDEDKGFLDDDDHLYSGGQSGGRGGQRRLRLVEDALGRRYSSDPYDEGDVREHDYGYAGEPEQLKVESMASRARPHPLSPKFEDYLDFDMDMDGRASWASADAELSPTPSYMLINNNATAQAHALTQAQAQAQMQTPGSGSTPTRTPALTDSSNSSSSAKSYSFMSSPSSSAFTNDYNRTPVAGMRYVDSSGYMRGQPDVGAGVHSNSTGVQQQGGQTVGNAASAQSSHIQSLYANMASGRGTGSVNGMTAAGTSVGVGGTSATLQQLRTQAALRAVQQHQHNQTQGRANSTQSPQALYRSALDSSSGLQRSPGGAGAGTGTTARFTPTPASIAAEMQTGLLVSSRIHQQNRARAASLVGHSQSPQGQGHGHGLTGPGIATSTADSSAAPYAQRQQQVTSGAVNSSSYPGDVYPDYTQCASRGSGSAALAGAFNMEGSSSPQVGHGQGNPAVMVYGVVDRTNTSGTGAGGASPFTHNGHEDANVHALERRWGDGLQRVHA